MRGVKVTEIPAGIYRHFRGREYQVFGVGRHSETEEPLVFYRCLYGDYSWWARPLSMFCEKVEVAGETLSRFRLVRRCQPWEMEATP